MSFSKDEIQRARLTAGCGINMPMGVLYDKAGQFSKDKFGLSESFIPKLRVPDSVAVRPEDFVEVPFRLISAAIIAGGTWRATDFTRPGVLKASVSKLNGKPVYKDHDTWTIDNLVGIVTNPVWTTDFKQDDGVYIPAGIDAIVRIDAKSPNNAGIARGVQYGGIFSNSVTIDFEWEPSHKFPNMYEFEDKIGTYAEDGSMIRRVASKILDYFESSLVWLGADPYAKLIDKDGNLVNVDITSTYEQENQAIKDSYTKDKKYVVGMSYTKDVLNMSRMSYSKEDETDKQNNNSNKNESMDKILEALRAKLGLAADAEVTPELIAGLMTANEVTAKIAEQNKDKTVVATSEYNTMKDNAEKFAKTGFTAEKAFTLKQVEDLQAEAGKVAGLNTQVETLTAEKTEALAKVEEMKPMVEQGQKFHKSRVDEAIRLYKLQAGDKATDAVVDLFSKADSAALDGLLSQYTLTLTHSFGGRCKKCGSNEFEFKSSYGTGDEGAKTVEGETVTEDSVSFEDLREKFKKNKKND